jgi:hypothetical protein
MSSPASLNLNLDRDNATPMILGMKNSHHFTSDDSESDEMRDEDSDDVEIDGRRFFEEIQFSTMRSSLSSSPSLSPLLSLCGRLPRFPPHFPCTDLLKGILRRKKGVGIS